MLAVAKNREIRASADKVWDALVDWKNEPKYWTNVRDIKVLKSEGARIEREATVGPRGFARKTRQTVVLEPMRSIRLSFEGEGVAGEKTTLVEPLAGGNTRVDVAWSLGITGVPDFVEAIIRNQLSKITEEALKKIGEAAERSEQRQAAAAAAVSPAP